MNSVAQAPSISSVSPTSGNIGSTVTIAGVNFSTAPSNNIVYFGAVKAAVLTATSTALTVTVPAGATFQPITVTTRNLTAYSSRPFLVTFAGGSIAYNSFVSGLDTTDLHPNGIVMADFDGDGKPDIATANNYLNLGTSSSVSVLQNTSIGGFISFAPAQTIVTGEATYAIAVGDLDGDGLPDMVSSSVVAGKISIFKNTSASGMISFAPKIDYPVGRDPFGIVIGDLDGDGKPDIIVANYLSNTLSVFANTSTPGNISFAVKQDITTGLTPQSLVLGDIDGDGKPDLVVVNFLAKSFSIFRNTGTPGNIAFAAKVDFQTGANNPFGVALGDIDGDGKSDVIITNNNYTSTSSATVSMSVFRNTGSPGIVSFAAQVNSTGTGNAENPVIADIDGDGNLDIIFPIASGQVSVYQNGSMPGQIEFPAVSNFQGLAPYSLVAGDMDGDGVPDMAATNFTLNTVSVFKNVMKAPHPYSFSPGTGNSGAVVSITGVNFTGATGVSFGGTPAASFTVVNSTRISAVVGTGSSGDVSVTGPFGTVGLSGFIFDGPPTVTSFSPISADSGLTVTITGTNFNGVTAVSFGGTPALSFTVVSPSIIQAVAGNGTSGIVSVSTGFGTGSLPGFVVAPPVIISFSPTSARAGDTITITGANFSGVQNVYFGGVPAASFTIVFPTQIIAVLPGGASGKIRLQTIRSVSVPGFTFISPPPPVIQTIVPNSALIGSTVTITGSNFNAIPANNTVYFGAVAASVTTATATSLTVVAPLGATYQPISVLNGSNGLTGYTPTSFSTTLPIPRKIDSSLFNPMVQIAETGFSASVCDIDGDGKVDLIGESQSVPFATSQWQITAMRNTGSPGTISFQPEQNFPLAYNFNGDIYGPGNILFADMDGDGKKDIVALNGGTSATAVSVLQNTSTPGAISFAPQVAYPALGTAQVFIADLNGDGRVDIIAGNGLNGGNIDIYLNASTVNHLVFGTMTKYYIPGSVLGFTDIDGDGKPDLILHNDNSNTDSGFTVSVLLNTSEGDSILFAPPVTIYSNVYDHFVTGATVGDIDGDGKPDLFIINSANSQGSFAVLRNASTPGTVAFSRTNYEVSGKPGAPLLADLNGDGKPELITIGNINDSSTFSVYQNLSSVGNIVLGPMQNYPASTLSGNISAADFDGDGKTDLLVAGIGDNILDFLHNTAIESPAISYTGPSSICSGDTVLLTSSIPENNQWYRNGLLIPGATSVHLSVAETGIYSVTAAINGVNLLVSQGISILVNPTPSKPVITMDAAHELVSSDTAGNQWYTDTTAIITGAVSQIYKPSFNGFYAVRVSENGCPSPFSAVYDYEAAATTGGATVTIIPNPAKDFITINYTLFVSENVFIELVDINGKKVLARANVQNGEILYVGYLPAGIYTLKLYSLDGRINTNVKIVKF